jgi:hypothetical protein
MGKVAYRFLPCDDAGRPRENSQYGVVTEARETLGVGSVIEADLFGYHEWKVIELRDESNSLFAATDADGTPIPLGGTLVCRGVR